MMKVEERIEGEEQPLTPEEKAILEGWAKEGVTRSTPVLIDGQECMAYGYDDYVLFKSERDGKTWGIMRDKVKSRSPILDSNGKVDVNAATLAWEVNGEIKSVEVRVSPKTPYITFFHIAGILVI